MAEETLSARVTLDASAYLNTLRQIEQATRTTTRVLADAFGRVDVAMQQVGFHAQRLAIQLSNLSAAQQGLATSTQSLAVSQRAVRDTTQRMSTGLTAQVQQARAAGQAQQSLKSIMDGIQGTLARHGQTLDQTQAPLRAFTGSWKDLHSALLNLNPRFQILQQRLEAMEQNVSQAVPQTAALGSSFRGLAVAIGAIVLTKVIAEVGQLTAAAIEASNQFTNFQLAFKSITGSSQAAADTLTFVRQEANRIGIDVVAATRSFQGFAAATKGTALEGEGAREVFTAMATASRVLGLSAQRTELIMLALQQMMNKGVVTQEELRRQLSESLPGAYQVAARAMGVTTSRLNDMVRAGDILAKDFVLPFARQYLKELGSGLDAVGQTFQAQTARMNNSLNALLVTLGDLITKSPDVIRAIQAITKAIDALQKMFEGQGAGGGVIGFFIRELAKNIENIAAIIRVFSSGGTDPTTQFQSLSLAIAQTEKRLVALNEEKETYERLSKASPGNEAEFAASLANTTKRMQEQLGVLADLVAQRDRLEKSGAGQPAEFTGLTTQPGTSFRQGMFELLQERVATGPGKINLGAVSEIRANIADVTMLLTRFRDRLSPDQILAAEDALNKWKKQLEDIQNRGLPKTTVALEHMMQRMRELQDFIAHPQGKSPEILEAARKELEALTRKTMPEALQGFAEMQSDIAELQGLIARGGIRPQWLLLLQDRLDELNTQQLPKALQETQRLVDEIASTERTIAAAGTLGLSDEQILQLQQHLAELKDRKDELDLSLARRIPPRQLDEWIRKSEHLIETFIRQNEVQRQQAQFDFELAQGTATNINQRMENYARLIVVLHNLGVEEERLAQLAHQASMELQQDSKQQAETRIEQEFRFKQAFATSAQERHLLRQQEIQAMQGAHMEETRINEKILDDTIQTLEEQTEAWRRFAEGVGDLASNFIFDAMTGKIHDLEDSLKGLRDLFAQIVADMVKKAVTEWVLTMTVKPQVQGAQGQTSGIPGTSGQGLNLSGLSSSGGGSFFSFLQGFGVGGTAQPLQGPTQSGQPLGGTNFFTQGQGFGVNAGTGMSFFGAIQSAMALGQAVGYKQGSEAIGRTSGQTAGQIIGVVSGNPIVGAIAGEILGLIGGAIGKAFSYSPHFDVDAFMAGQFRAGPTGISVGRGFLTPAFGQPQFAHIPSETQAQINQLFDQAGTKLAEDVAAQANALPRSFQKGLVGPLNAASERLATQITAFESSGANSVEDVQKFITEEVPGLVQQTFGAILDAVKKIAPLAQEWEQTIAALRQQQAATLGALRGARGAIAEGLFTPAQSFEARRAELEGLVQRFDVGSPRQQARLAPQIAQLAQTVFGLAQDQNVFGGDVASLKELQAELLDIIDETTATTKTVYEQQIEIGQQQIKILQNSLQTLVGIDRAVNKSTVALNQIARFLNQGVGTFQEGGIVPRTGMAFVHQGEVVVPYMGRGPASAAVMSVTTTHNRPVHVTVNYQGAGQNREAVEQLASRIATEIHRRERFRQDPTAPRRG